MLRQPPPLYELGGYRQIPPAVATIPKPAQEKAEFCPVQPPPPGSSCGGLRASGPGPSSRRDARCEQQQLRRKINSRERKRMQDLNLAMDALREVIVPYSAAHCQSTPGRKLSKIATLLLARNYILLLGSSLQELRRIIGEMSGSGPRLLLAGLPLFAAGAAPPGPVLLAAPTGGNQHHHHAALPPPPHSDSSNLRSASKYLAMALEEQQQQGGQGHLLLPGGPGGGGGLCPCALCKLPHFIPPPGGALALAPIQAAPFSK